MTPEEIYDVWAPAEGPWSPWVKPVLFAHIARTPLVPLDPEGEGIEAPWEPPRPRGVAIVVDLPGVESVRLGLRLATRGYRPVPVFNACPGPGSSPEVVAVRPILAAIVGGTPALQAASVPADAPPAFLLDSARGPLHLSPAPGTFDNRSVVFATDFPSANFLQSRGIGRVVLVRKGRPADDLIEVLQDWRKGGLELLDASPPDGTAPGRLSLPPQLGRWVARLSRQLMALMFLRRAWGGGFGGFVPEASSSGVG